MATTTFPDTDTLFAFNRYVATVREADEGDEYILTVALTDYSISYRDVRVADENGSIDFSFGYYLRLLFAQADILAGDVTVSAWLRIGQSGGRPTDYYPTVYWGAISAGERLADRTLRYYPAFDNPLPYWVLQGATSMIQKNNEAQEDVGTGRINAINDLRDLFSVQAVEGVTVGDIVTLTQIFGDTNQSTFDETFDYTFWAFGEGDIVRTKVIVDCGTSGVYLKWIDPQGCWYYYLFEPFSKTSKTKAIGDDYETFTEGVNVGYVGALRPMGKTMEQTQTIVAPLVSRAERNMLETILQSPFVYWCPDTRLLQSSDASEVAAAEWLPVRIVAGSTTDDQNDMDDFEITIQYPDKQAQVL